MKVQEIAIQSIAVDPKYQPRANGLDEAHVEDLRAAYAAGAKVDPVRVWRVGGAQILSRGYHRIEGARRAGLKRIPAEVFEGTMLDCKIDAITSNQEHNALKRTKEDKRRAVEMLLDVCPEWDQRTIAEKAGVGQQLVGEVRAERAAKTVATTGKLSESLNFPCPTKPKQKGQGKGGGRKPTKVKTAEKIALALKADNKRTDAQIAAEVGCKEPEVKKRRDALVADGLIEEWFGRFTDEELELKQEDAHDDEDDGTVIVIQRELDRRHPDPPVAPAPDASTNQQASYISPCAEQTFTPAPAAGGYAPVAPSAPPAPRAKYDGWSETARLVGEWKLAIDRAESREELKRVLAKMIDDLDRF